MTHICVVANDTAATGLYAADPHGREQAVRTRDAVCTALTALGHNVTVMRAGPGVPLRLEKEAPDAVFNLVTGYISKKDQAGFAALLELTGIPFTGSGSRAHLVGLHKHIAKIVMGSCGVPTPRFCLVTGDQAIAQTDLNDLKFPVMVKPAAEGSSAGISSDSVAPDQASALRQVERVYRQFGPPVLVEEFVDGREFTVGILGYPDPAALPVEEICFKRGSTYTYDVKVRDTVEPVCPADLPADEARLLQSLALRTFNAVGCRDFARVDIRVSSGAPYVLEINTLPGLMPGYSEMVRMSEKAGMEYKDLIGKVLDGALLRSSASAGASGRREGRFQWMS